MPQEISPTQRNALDRAFPVFVIALLIVMAVAQICSIRLEAQTFDEAMHLAAGLSYWRTGDYRMNPEHPALGKLLNAAPLLFMPVRLPLEHPAWKAGDEVEFGKQFLYNNRIPADDIL